MEAIFAENFRLIEIVNPEQHTATFEVDVYPHGDEPHVAVALVLTFHSDYPHKRGPKLDVRALKGLSEEARLKLQQSLRKFCSRKAGTPLGYLVYDYACDLLDKLNQPPAPPPTTKALYDEMTERARRQQVNDEQYEEEEAATFQRFRSQAEIQLLKEIEYQEQQKRLREQEVLLLRRKEKQRLELPEGGPQASDDHAAAAEVLPALPLSSSSCSSLPDTPLPFELAPSSLPG